MVPSVWRSVVCSVSDIPSYSVDTIRDFGLLSPLWPLVKTIFIIIIGQEKNPYQSYKYLRYDPLFLEDHTVLTLCVGLYRSMIFIFLV